MKELSELIQKLTELNKELAVKESIGVWRAQRIMVLCDLMKDICIDYIKRRKGLI